MRIRMAFVVLAVVITLGAQDTSAADMNETGEMGGAVTPCSLDGVNPAHHPKIFGNPAVAKSYGFVKSRDGSWQVRPNCRR